MLFPFLQEAICKAGYTGCMKICMDTAASEFWNQEMGKYDLDFKTEGEAHDQNAYVCNEPVIIEIYTTTVV